MWCKEGPTLATILLVLGFCHVENPLKRGWWTQIPTKVDVHRRVPAAGGLQPVAGGGPQDSKGLNGEGIPVGGPAKWRFSFWGWVFKKH